MDNWNQDKKVYTPLQAKQKAESYCAYQERAQQEVRDKLDSWGVYGNEAENIIVELIEGNFLNEERFATVFAIGKFRMKGWGKIKIKNHLKQKYVSAPLIKIALAQIEEEDYDAKLQDIINRKISKDISTISMSEKASLIRFLQSKGYENDRIFKKLNQHND